MVHFCEFVNLTFRIGEMRRPSGALSSTESKEVGREAITNVPVGTASRLGLIGWVVLVVCWGSHPHWRCGGGQF